MKKSLLIIALSARPFVEAAVKAGYAVTAMDAFADQQTVELAEKTVVVDYGGLGFDAANLLTALHSLDLSPFIGFVYGSGFEAQPELLKEIAAIIPLIGNSPETLAVTKNAASFFATLQQLKIMHPKVCEALPTTAASDVYLTKFSGGSGGTHIKIASVNDENLLDNHYYQQRIIGQSVSLLFVANGHDVEVVGFNEQWVNASDVKPFRYGGAVSNIMLSQGVQLQLIAAAEQLTEAWGLLGLNSLDAIVQERCALNEVNERVYILEVNPRLSATVDLYDNADENLLAKHVQTCLNLKRFWPDAHRIKRQPKAQAIVYADSEMEITTSIAWPDWVVDNPAQSTHSIKILAGEPICTVIAYADCAETAKILAQARIKIVWDLLR